MPRRPTAALSPGYAPTPYWWDGVELPGTGPDRVPAEADVAVIGAGYTGLGAALELARRGRRALVIDRGPIASGASSRNGGIVHAGGKLSLPGFLALADGRALWDVTVAAVDGLEALIGELGIDCGWRRTGHLELAHHPRVVAHLRAEADAYASIGHRAAVVTGDELAAEIGSDRYPAGLVVEGSAGVHPARLAAGLAGAAATAGAALSPATEVLGIDRDGAAFTVRTSAGAVRAGEVVVATNGYTGALVPWLTRRVRPIGSYIIATEPLDAARAAALIPRGRMVFDTRNFLCYWRLSPDGTRVLFGGRTSFAPTTVERARDALYRRLVLIHPQLAGVAVDRAWGGNVALTADRLPHIGRYGRSGVVYAMGYCGTGVAMATHLGRLAGAWLAGDGALPPLAGRRWPRIPAPGRVDALLPAAGWWYQARDRLGV